MTKPEDNPIWQMLYSDWRLNQQHLARVTQQRLARLAQDDEHEAESQLQHASQDHSDYYSSQSEAI